MVVGGKVFLESQLEAERHRLEAERQRVAVAEEQIRILVSVCLLKAYSPAKSWSVCCCAAQYQYSTVQYKALYCPC